MLNLDEVSRGRKFREATSTLSCRRPIRTFNRCLSCSSCRQLLLITSHLLALNVSLSLVFNRIHKERRPSKCKSDAFQDIQRYDATQANACSQFAHAQTCHTRLHINASNIPHIERTLPALSTDTRVRSEINTTSSQHRAVI